jgi:hypothetical protein
MNDDMFLEKIKQAALPVEESWRKLESYDRETNWKLIHEMIADLRVFQPSAELLTRFRRFALWLFDADIHSRGICFDIMDAVDKRRKELGITV